ncbi:MAG: hypothetical protein A2293_13705 [Elusimicrobia bacterium RIFOXYB2_FULL_49_7]|nr:MAG: hypothetical protein A2293_13705 [Elusimicrobia bacterium RIFOXYB2_FULL_49_7]
MKRNGLISLVLLAILCQLSFGQNARMNALGNPCLGVQGKNLIEDVSDVLYFPSEVATSTDMAQGVSSGYVYASKSIFKTLSIGFLFGKSSYTQASGLHTGLLNAYADVGAYVWQTGVPTGAPVPVAGDFDLNAPTVPTNVGHFLIGLRLGNAIQIGADIFREASNSDIDSKIAATIAPGTPGAYIMTIESNGTSSYGTMGLNAGAALDVGLLKLKVATGLILPSYSAEITNKGNDTDPAGATTYNIEISKMEATSAYYFPLTAKGTLKLEEHTITAGFDMVSSGCTFEASFDDGDPGTTAEESYKSDEYSSIFFAFGVADEIAVSPNTRFIPSLTLSRNSESYKPQTVDSDNPEETYTTTTFPRATLAMEHTVNDFWKFNKVVVRAGGSKSYYWQSQSLEGGITKVDFSDEPTYTAFSWYTGLGMTYGALTLDLYMLPSEWNGIYLLSGEGPAGIGSGVTLTYKIGAGSAN